MKRKLFKTHAWLDVDSVGNAQSLRLSHQGLAHVAATDDDQAGPRMLFENRRHRAQKRAVPLACHESTHGEEKGC